MSIEETIKAAAERFSVSVEVIRSARKGGDISRARQWIVAQHPEATCTALAKALNLTSHHAILYIRRKLSQLT